MDEYEDEYDGPAPEDIDDQPDGHQVLADLLGHLDKFIRCREMGIADQFIRFLEDHGHPAWQADAIINELCFTAAHYQRQADYETGLISTPDLTEDDRQTAT